MFGFGGSSSPKPASSSSNSSTPLPAEAPNREQRAACWAARDAYFACLDKNGMVAAGDEGEGGDVCAEERRRYEGGCGKSWVSPFVVSSQAITRGRQGELCE
jgi:cytochrome c oxidase assembly factor 6